MVEGREKGERMGGIVQSSGFQGGRDHHGGDTPVQNGRFELVRRREVETTGIMPLQ